MWQLIEYISPPNDLYNTVDLLEIKASKSNNPIKILDVWLEIHLLLNTIENNIKNNATPRIHV